MQAIMVSDQSSETASVKTPDIKTLRAAIPDFCFRPSLFRSLQYVVRDLTVMTALYYLALQFITVQNPVTRFLLWTAYGFVQGLVFTGIWILAHECGHDSFSSYKRLNTCLGFFLHSILLVPFFSWRYSHSRHHRYANHMEKDTTFVASRKEEYRSSFLTGSFLGHTEDAPIVTLVLLIAQQLFGWPMYILFNISAGAKSFARSDLKKSIRQSHIDPTAPIFTRSECPYVLLSDLGLCAVISALLYLSSIVGFSNTLKIYGLPYLWMNHWIIAITFLHHTHPEAPRYEQGSWTYEKGALSTVDRDFGFIGRHLFHGIIEYHVIHHLFPRIPFYHAEEATAAIAPLLGKRYLRQESSFVRDLWSTFKTCSYVEEDPIHRGNMYWSTASTKKNSARCDFNNLNAQRCI